MQYAIINSREEYRMSNINSSIYAIGLSVFRQIEEGTTFEKALAKAYDRHGSKNFVGWEEAKIGAQSWLQYWEDRKRKKEASRLREAIRGAYEMAIEANEHLCPID